MTDRELRKRKMPDHQAGAPASGAAQPAPTVPVTPSSTNEEDSCRRQVKTDRGAAGSQPNSCSGTPRTPMTPLEGASMASDVPPLPASAAWPMPMMFAVAVTTTTSFFRQDDPGQERKASLRSHAVKHRQSSSFPGLTQSEEDQLRAAHEEAHRAAVERAIVQAAAYQQEQQRALMASWAPVRLVPRTLSQEVIDQEELDRCTICMDDFAPSQTVSTLGCGHTSHYTCLQQWVRFNASCPNCRASA